jgi:hypothetical protein
MKTGSPTDERCQLMVDPMGLSICWKTVFVGIAHVLSHTTKHENEARDVRQIVAGVVLVETHDKLKRVGHFRTRSSRFTGSNSMCCGSSGLAG